MKNFIVDEPLFGLINGELRMKKYLWILFIITASTATWAESDLDCSILTNYNADELAICIAQVDDNLNVTYKQLRATHKDNREVLRAIRSMQLGWIKMRDAQCLFRGLSSASSLGGGQAALHCEIQMTIQREKELSLM